MEARGATVVGVRALTVCVSACLGLSIACGESEPKGHASVFECVGGRIAERHVPLSKTHQVAHFTACGDGSCVSG